jgi:hypothetical protein
VHKGYGGGSAIESNFGELIPLLTGTRQIRASSWWTGADAGTILRPMTAPAPRCPTCGSPLATHDQRSLLASGDRLTPWMLHDLPRIAWIVEYRAGELTDEERQIVRDATARMLRALEFDAV